MYDDKNKWEKGGIRIQLEKESRRTIMEGKGRGVIKKKQRGEQ